jgi:hypothetical protein
LITPFGGTLADLSPVEGRVEVRRVTAQLKFTCTPLPHWFKRSKSVSRPATHRLAVVPSMQRDCAVARLAIPRMRVS